MDILAGSEPRIFISFHLDKEFNGQPAQESEDLDTTSPALAGTDQIANSSDDEIEVIEITLSSPECTDVETERQHDVTVKVEPEFPTTLLFSDKQGRCGFSCNSSTGSYESCGAYFARKLEELERSASGIPDLGALPEIKESESEQLVVYPSQSRTSEMRSESSLDHDPMSQSRPISLAKFLKCRG